AFLEGFRHLHSLKDRAVFAGWVITIARRRAWRMKTSRRPEASLPEGTESIASAEEPSDMMEFVARLPPRERHVIVLKYFEGYDSTQIGAILVIHPGTVTKQLSRAYERLRHLLAREEK